MTAIASVLCLTSGKFYRKILRRRTQTYMTESVAGLNVNAPVRYRGVDVGRVRRITARAGQRRAGARSLLEIERGTPIKEDTVALLETQGLTGIAFVDLTAGHRGSPPLRREARRGVPGDRVGRVADEPPRVDGADAARRPHARADNLNATMDEDNRQALKRTLADLRVLSRTLAARSRPSTPGSTTPPARCGTRRA